MQILALNSVFQNSVPYVLGEPGLLGLSVPCDKHSRKLRKDKEGMASTERERRGKLISGTASVGKQDPSASGFNEKGPNGNLKSGSASNPQSSGSLERGVRSIPSLIRAVCEIHIPILFSNHKFCQRCVLRCEIFFFFFIPFANLIPRSKSSFPSRTSRSWDVLFAAGKLCCALCGVVRGWKGSPACR